MSDIITNNEISIKLKMISYTIFKFKSLMFSLLTWMLTWFSQEDFMRTFRVKSDHNRILYNGLDSFEPCSVIKDGKQCESDYYCQSNLVGFFRDKHAGKHVVCPRHTHEAHLRGYQTME